MVTNFQTLWTGWRSLQLTKRMWGTRQGLWLPTVSILFSNSRLWCPVGQLHELHLLTEFLCSANHVLGTPRRIRQGPWNTDRCGRTGERDETKSHHQCQGQCQGGLYPCPITLEQPEVDLFNMLTFRESFYLGKPASAAFVFWTSIDSTKCGFDVFIMLRKIVNYCACCYFFNSIKGR